MVAATVTVAAATVTVATIESKSIELE